MSRLTVLEKFHSSWLNNTRSVRIYLPPSYHQNSHSRYPVLYLQDGQNLFSAETAFAKVAWNIHSTADDLASAGHIQEVILVGIDNTAERFSEYAYQSASPDDMGHVEGRGHLYARFLRDELIPYIDGTFRTKAEPAQRGIMGSSMGGLLSFHVALQNPDLFAMAGCLSSAFRWADNHTLDMLLRREYPEGSRPKLWLDLGDSEEAPIKETRDIARALLEQGWTFGENLAYYEEPGGGHFETDWARRVHMPLRFFFGNIGEPVELSLALQQPVGIAGRPSFVNPVVGFNTGVRMTDVTAAITSEPADRVSVSDSGQVRGAAPGRCRVSVDSHGFAADQEFAVVEEVPVFAKVRLVVQVPPSTPLADTIYLGLVTQPDFLPLVSAGSGIFQTETEVPRHWKILFAFTRGTKETMEVHKGSAGLAYRETIVPDDGEYRFTVAGWQDDGVTQPNLL